MFIFNLACTYHAASPPGSEQERLEYALNSKRKAVILALRWANTHTYMLQEDPAAISFLEVKREHAVKWQHAPCTDPLQGIERASVAPQELYGSITNDSRMLRALKDLVPDVEKIATFQLVSSASTFNIKLFYYCFFDPTLVTFMYWVIFCTFSFSHVVVQKNPNHQKRYVQTTVYFFFKCIKMLPHSDVDTEMLPCDLNRNPLYDNSATERKGCRRSNPLGIMMTVRVFVCLCLLDNLVLLRFWQAQLPNINICQIPMKFLWGYLSSWGDEF